MRPYEEFNKKLQQLFVPLDQAEGKTVKKTEVDGDSAIIAWTDGTYSQLEATNDGCDYCNEAEVYQSEDPVMIFGRAQRAVELGIVSREEFEVAAKDWRAKNEDYYRNSKMAEFNRLKQELGL